MKLAKPLKVGGSPLMIVTGSSLLSGRMAEQLHRSVDREVSRAARSFASSPKHDKPRKKVVEMEGERVTYRKASNSVCAIGECALFPSGSVAVVRIQRGVINLGDLCVLSKRGKLNQLTEVKLTNTQESDSSIVVRDGRADHMAKGWAEWITEQSTQAGELSVPHYMLVTHPVQPEDLQLLSCKLLRVHLEEPYAGVPHVGICEGAVR